MLPLASVGLASSTRAAFRAAVLLLAWLALWFSVLIPILDRPLPKASQPRVQAAATQRA